MNIDFNKRSASFVHITPEMAAQFLDRNKENRRLRKGWSEALSQEIKNGNYKTTHQGIAFNKSGVLVDGQHRLEAIRQSNQTVEMLVTTGLDDDVFKDIDRGLKRSLSDSTHLPKKCAEACRIAAEYAFSTTIVSSQDAIDIANTGFEQLHNELIEECSSTAQIFSSAPARMMAIVMIMDSHDKEYVFGIYRSLVTMNLSKIPKIAESLVRRVAQGTIKSGGGASQRELIAMYKKIYDVGYKDCMLRISDADVSSTVAYVKDVINKYL